MLDILLIRLDAPIFSFGGPTVDENSITGEFPSASAITGLIGNALGYCHRDAELLQGLQRRVRIAVRSDCPGMLVVDFQTVGLQQPFMSAAGWTTRGVIEGRSGGSAKRATHIRYRWYRADSVMTIALTLEPASASPTVDDVERALKQPERPLFIGRKCCIPSGPLFLGRRKSSSLLAALRQTPLPDRPGARKHTAVDAWWPVDEEEVVHDSRTVVITDERDWANQIHVGQREIRHGRIELSGEEHGNAE